MWCPLALREGGGALFGERGGMPWERFRAENNTSSVARLLCCYFLIWCFSSCCGEEDGDNSDTKDAKIRDDINVDKLATLMHGAGEYKTKLRQDYPLISDTQH